MYGSFRKFVPALILTVLAASGAAEDATPQRWLVTNYEIKPGMQGHHEMLARRYLAAAEATDWDTPWFTSTSLFSETSHVSVAIPIETMEMFAEPPSMIVDAEGPEAIAEIQEVASRTYASVTTVAAVSRPDLSNPAPQSDTPPVAYISITATVKPGGEEAYAAYVRRIVEASDAQYWTLFQGTFGAANTYVANVPIFAWSDMDEAPGPSIPQRLRAAFGEEEGNAIYQDGAALIEDIEWDLMRWRWDLSWFVSDD